MASLATCSDVIRFWDTSGGGGGLELRKTTNVAAAVTNSCCWNHNGQVVATAGDNGCITVLKLSGSIVPAGVLSAHEKPIRGITFSSKSRKLAAGGDAGVVEVWDLKRNNSRVTMRGHRGAVTCLSFFDRDTCVAAGDERGKVILHRVADAPSDDEASTSLPPAGGYSIVTGLSMASASASPATLGVSYSDGAVRLWDTGSRACVREMPAKHRGAAAGILFHPHNSSLFATVGHDGVVRCTDVRIGGGPKDGGGEGVVTSIQTDAPLTCASFHHEGLTLAAGGSDGTVRLVDLRTAREIGGRPKDAYAGPTPPSGGVRAVAFQRQAPSRSGASSGVAASGGVGSASAGARAPTGSSRPRPAAAAAAAAAASSSSGDLRKAVGHAGGGGSGRSRRASDGGGNGGGGGGGDGYNNARGGSGGQEGYGDGSVVRRPTSQATATPVPATIGDDLAQTAAAAAVAGLVEATPLFPTSNGSAQHQQHQHQRRRQDQYQQPAAEHTSSSRGNGDYYAPAPAIGAAARGGGGGGGTGLPSSRQRPRPEPPGSSRTAAVAAGGRDSYHHQPVATPPRERGDAAPRWGESNGRGGANGTAKAAQVTGKSSAYSEPPPPAAAAAAAAAGRPDSNSPERVAAPGFDWRRRENGAGDGSGIGSGGGGGMAAGEGDQWEDSSAATAHESNSRHGEAAFLYTPDSRGARVNARSGGGGGGADGSVTGYDDDRNGFSSPSRAPRKQAAHPGGGLSTGARAAAEAAAAGDAKEEIARREPKRAEATAGVGQVVSLDRSVLEQVLSSHVSGLREELRQELRNLHVDMLRQFQSLQDEQSSALSGFEERLGGLVAENQALRAENDRLRRVY